MGPIIAIIVISVLFYFGLRKPATIKRDYLKIRYLIGKEKNPMDPNYHEVISLEESLVLVDEIQEYKTTYVRNGEEKERIQIYGVREGKKVALYHDTCRSVWEYPEQFYRTYESLVQKKYNLDHREGESTTTHKSHQFDFKKDEFEGNMSIAEGGEMSMEKNT